MKHLNKKNDNRYVKTAATIFTLTIITASITATPAAATTMTTTTTSPEAAGLELSQQPVLRGRQIATSETPINQTHILVTESGNGTITLPNTTEAINFTGNYSIIVSIVDGTAIANEVFTTLDGTEVVNGTAFAMSRFNMEEGTGRAIVTLLLQTNSTGRLAPVDGMILAGHIEFFPDGSAESTLWEWQSGVPLPPSPTTPAQDSPPPMETPTATDATADDTTAAAAPAPEQGEGGEEQQQQQTTIAPNPLFE